MHPIIDVFLNYILFLENTKLYVEAASEVFLENVCSQILEI